MANKKPVAKTKKAQVLIKPKVTKHHLLKVIGLVLLFILVACMATYYICRDVAEHRQEQRFNQVNTIFSDFEANVKHSVGSSLISISENKSCDYPEEVIIGKGSLYCGESIEGTVNAQLSNEKSLLSQIVASVSSALKQSKVPYTQTSHDRKYGFGTNGSADYSDTYNLFGQQMGCDVEVSTPFTSTDVNNAQYKVHSLYFVIDCQQQNSVKAYFPIQK